MRQVTGLPERGRDAAMCELEEGGSGREEISVTHLRPPIVCVVVMPENPAQTRKG
jgi:hypothetical protein